MAQHDDDDDKSLESLNPQQYLPIVLKLRIVGHYDATAAYMFGESALKLSLCYICSRENENKYSLLECIHLFFILVYCFIIFFLSIESNNFVWFVNVG